MRPAVSARKLAGPARGHNLRVTQDHAGKDGDPSRHLLLKFTLQFSENTAGREGSSPKGRGPDVC